MTSDLAERFRQAVSWLDSAFARVQGAHFLQGWEIRDDSNVSGFDWAVPYYRWSKSMTRDRPVEGEVWRSTVQVTYLEPWDVTHERTVRIEAATEIFQRGSESRLKSRTENVVPLDRARVDLIEMVERACRDAEAALPTGWRNG